MTNSITMFSYLQLEAGVAPEGATLTNLKFLEAAASAATTQSCTRVQDGLIYFHQTIYFYLDIYTPVLNPRSIFVKVSLSFII